jgi:hypothetical protein
MTTVAVVAISDSMILNTMACVSYTTASIYNILNALTQLTIDLVCGIG